MENILNKIIYFFVIFIFFINYCLAQLPPGFDTGVDDGSTAAPISGLITLGVIIGAIVGYKKLKDSNDS